MKKLCITIIVIAAITMVSKAQQTSVNLAGDELQKNLSDTKKEVAMLKTQLKDTSASYSREDQIKILDSFMENINLTMKISETYVECATLYKAMSLHMNALSTENEQLKKQIPPTKRF